MPESKPLSTVQADVEAWANRYWDGEYWPPLANLARVAEEVGEIARGINQIDGPKRLKKDEAHADLEIEFGDLIFALTCLANSLDIDLDAGFQGALEKYRVRDQGE